MLSVQRLPRFITTAGGSSYFAKVGLIGPFWTTTATGPR